MQAIKRTSNLLAHSSVLTTVEMAQAVQDAYALGLASADPIRLPSYWPSSIFYADRVADRLDNLNSPGAVTQRLYDGWPAVARMQSDPRLVAFRRGFEAGS